MATFDLNFDVLPVEDQRTSGGPFGFGDSPPVGIRGFKRLINRWLLEFFTDQGSDPTDIERGTVFPRLFGSNISSVRDITDACQISVAQCNARIALYESESPPESAEETLADAVIQDIDFDNDGLGFTLVVRLRNAAGINASIALPTTTGDTL